MPVLFLDVDGVLNTTESQIDGGMTNFTEEAVSAVKTLVEEAAFNVVVSSTWRADSLPLLKKALEARGVGELSARIVGGTPTFSLDSGAGRGDEIDAWLYQNKFSGRMVILDDEPTIPELAPWWVMTDARTGLTDGLARQALAILNDGPVYSQSPFS